MCVSSLSRTRGRHTPQDHRGAYTMVVLMSDRRTASCSLPPGGRRDLCPWIRDYVTRGQVSGAWSVRMSS